ncbi:hypothetical protein D3C72_1859880 [compost metagenome]
MATVRLMGLQTYFRPAFFSRAPGSMPASHRTWKPLQMPRTATPSSAAFLTACMIGAWAAIAPQRR